MATDQPTTRAEEIGAAARADIVKVETALTEFDKISAGLAELRSKYEGVVFDVKTPAGMKAATTARAEIRTPRYATESARKAAKAPVLALGKNIDERAAYITAELLKIEAPLDQQIKAEEQRKEAERQAREKAEHERLARIQAGIEELKQYPLEAAGKSAAEIAETMDRLELVQVKAWAFEFADIAEQAKVKSMNRLREMHTRAADQEAEAARLAAERAQLERQRAEQEERARADAARVAEETRKREAEERERLDRIAAEERAAKDRIAAQEREAAAERERQDREARMAREAEEARLRAIREEEEARLAEERRRLDEQQRALEQKARDEQFAKDEAARAARLEEQRKREAEENARAEAERERRREETELMDAEAMLRTFKQRFGHIKAFASIVRAINAYAEKAGKVPV